MILPEVVERLSNIPYHRGSPYGGKTSSDPTIGDIHQWNVWHGSQEPWSSWDKLAGRFVSYVLYLGLLQNRWRSADLDSEFGMQGYPDRRTVDTWSEDKSQLFPQSHVSLQHNKAVRGVSSRPMPSCQRQFKLIGRTAASAV